MTDDIHIPPHNTDYTYIYDDLEVKTTSRTASKELPGGKKAVMHEITPLDQDQGTWKKWVNLAALFRIQ